MSAKPLTLEKVLETAADGNQFEANVVQFKRQQYLELQQQAQHLSGRSGDCQGPDTQERWNALVEKAAADYPNGRFLLELMGAKRYLDPELMAVLMHLRQHC